MKIIKSTSALEVALRGIQRNRVRSQRSADRVARRVIQEIRRDGDEAASRIVEEFDGVAIPAAELLIGPSGQPGKGELSDAIDLAIQRIERFHRGQVTSDYSLLEDGSELLHRVRPLRRVGIYAPGGTAVYLSTLIMCAVPARLAGVQELVVATTPAAASHPEFLDCCSRLGIGEIYRAGGPAGIAAMALGTGSLRRVDKIVGPGNAYVTAAKKRLIGEVGIDMLAGPTELVLIADDAASAELVASDLLAQAEHGRDSVVVCIAFSAAAAREISAVVARRLDSGDESARACITGNSFIAVVATPADAVALANRIAPEHLSLHWKEAGGWLEQLENCGAIFVGAASPVAAGDYIAGPNHVLPTSGTARFTSPLGVYDFVKRSNVINLGSADSGKLAGPGAAIARFEGLPGHARSLELRKGAQS